MLRLIEVADIHPDPVLAVWHRVFMNQRFKPLLMASDPVSLILLTGIIPAKDILTFRHGRDRPILTDDLQACLFTGVRDTRQMLISHCTYSFSLDIQGSAGVFTEAYIRIVADSGKEKNKLAVRAFVLIPYNQFVFSILALCYALFVVRCFELLQRIFHGLDQSQNDFPLLRSATLKFP